MAVEKQKPEHPFEKGLIIDTRDSKIVKNDDLLVSVFRDKAAGELYVCLQDKTEPKLSMLITAEAVFQLADVVERIFDKPATTRGAAVVH